MSFHRGLLIVFFIAGFQGSVLSQQSPPPFFPGRVTPPPPALQTVTASLGIANTCACKAALFVRLSGKGGNWTEVDAEENTIGTINLLVGGSWDVTIRQWVGDDVINEFDAGSLSIPDDAAKDGTILKKIQFHPTSTLFSSNGEWRTIPLDSSKTVDVDLLIGSGRALFVVPMVMRGGALPVNYDPPRPFNPRPTGGK